ncbi:hypothetical protein [Aurantiacibacter flavus]|uniref:Uncharacterized protein n=1 Tax=Aurantiacibacter flavus TaxID=3145232 RepID=A0ABV0D308_9SPHN
MRVPTYMKRYLSRIILFMSGYCVVLVGGIVLRDGGAGPEVRVAMALLSAGMICGVFWTIFRLLAECDDEYQRMLWVKQVLLATAATLAISTCWQFLAVFEVLAEGPRWFGVMWLAMFGFASPVVR